ncbi:MAG: hypothetical protein GF315_11250 [candidate division Zixibacteria bacterium]|nr:hypothetical protein [candidate division Zixibacteria bacterium]
MDLRNFTLYITCLLVAGLFVNSNAGQNRLTIDNLKVGELEARAFELSRDSELRISATGAKYKTSGEALRAYAWIIDSQTREEIWRMKSNNVEQPDRDKLRVEFNEMVFFERGAYEVYYYILDGKFSHVDINGAKEVFDFLRELLSNDEGTDWKKLRDRLGAEIRGNEEYFKPKDDKRDFEPLVAAKPLLRFTQLPDDYYHKEYFSLNDDTELHIYLIGEYSKYGHRLVDGAWIVSLESGTRIWEPNQWNTELAGGALKNRMFNDEVRLSSGQYVLHVMTDDSHSFAKWNAMPPSDPYFWGVTIFPASRDDAKVFEKIEEPHQDEPLLAITGVGDRAYRMQSFQLNDNAKLRIYCFGEYDNRDNSFVDYGWIEHDDTREAVWELTYDNSVFAGGASKNRVFDGIVSLPKGRYTAYYITDNSHSYNRWNQSPPYDPKNYGITIYSADDDFNEEEFQLVDSRADSDKALAKLIRLGDDSRVSRGFSLDKPTRIHIYAIGEGDRHGMYDYGWLEKTENSLVIWEMTYRNTRPAGGASKNRLFDGEIMLDKGDYIVHFVTDESHSFQEWNAPKPRDPVNWGIVITRR